MAVAPSAAVPTKTSSASQRPVVAAARPARVSPSTASTDRDPAPTTVTPQVPPAKRSYPRFRGRTRFRARRVRRLIRHVDPWSVFKLALLLSTCMWVIFEVAGLTLWSVATSAGTIESIETNVAKAFGLSEFTINADKLFRYYSLSGLILTLSITGAAVIGTILFNLISDLIGGIWISVIEEENAETV